MNPGYLRHFILCLRLNIKSPQALIYGYLVPVLFLLAFGSVFRTDTPALLHEMGQLLTITVLGGACFGLPTALVSERERGVWRRYRLLPVPVSGLLLSTLAARLLIIASAGLLQCLLARAVFGTPFPEHPWAMLLAAVVVTASFLGLGLLVAALANDVPAVQALGQCLFLPMILIGGVGVPLSVLPDFAQKIAGFMPGRYAVDVLQKAYEASGAFAGTGFSYAALILIGAAAALAGSVLFRWEPGPRRGLSLRLWLSLAFSSWLAVGLAASWTGRLAPVGPLDNSFTAVTEEQIAGITYDDLTSDQEFAGRLSRPAFDAASTRKLAELGKKLRDWSPRKCDDPGQSVRYLVSLAALADLSQDSIEGDLARAVFDDLRTHFDPPVLKQALAWVILRPKQGRVVSTAPELGLNKRPHEDLIRSRCVLYAQKYLGRLEGKLRD